VPPLYRLFTHVIKSDAPLSQDTSGIPFNLAGSVHRSCARWIEPNSAQTRSSARIVRPRYSIHHPAPGRHAKHCGKVAATRTIGIDGGSPKSVDLADHCFDGVGDAGGQSFLGFRAHDHFLGCTGCLCSLEGGKVTNPSNRAERPRTGRWNPAEPPDRATPHTPTPENESNNPIRKPSGHHTRPEKIRVREHSCVANHWTARDGNLDSLEIAGAAPLFGRPGPNSAASWITPTWRAAISTCSAIESDMPPPKSPATPTDDCDRLDPRPRHVRQPSEHNLTSVFSADSATDLQLAAPLSA
jgi:hypothetical protein